MKISKVLRSTVIMTLGILLLSTSALAQQGSVWGGSGSEIILGSGASELAQLTASMEPGTWAELHTEGFTWEAIASSGGEGGNIFDYSDSATWDPGTQKLFFIGKGYAQRPWKFISYAAETNTWAHLPDPFWFGERENGHGYDNNAIDPVTGIFYHLKSAMGEVYSYDIATSTWEQIPDLPHTYLSHGTALAYFPEMGGLIRVLAGKVHFYNENMQSWSVLAEGLPMGGYHNIAEYSAGAGAMLIGGGNDGGQLVHRISADGSVTRLANAPVGLASHGSVVITDPVSGDFLVISGSGSFYSYDILLDRWELISNDLPFDFGDSWGGHRTLAAPISNYGVTLFAKGWLGSDGQVFLYKHVASHSPDGDLNLDGVVNSEDVSLCADVILGYESNMGIVDRADVNVDGEVNARDLQLIINGSSLE